LVSVLVDGRKTESAGPSGRNPLSPTELAGQEGESVFEPAFAIVEVICSNVDVYFRAIEVARAHSAAAPNTETDGIRGFVVNYRHGNKLSFDSDTARRD
jgi:hypothetical protein